MSFDVPTVRNQPQSTETIDLRNHPYKAPAFPLPYRALPAAKQTDGVQVGTQARFIAAARAAAAAGFTMNTLLSIRWTSLFSDGDVNHLRTMPIPQRIDYMVELFRKWWTKRALPVFCIWVREVADSTGEHWHIAFHLPKKHHRAFADYVARLTQEPIRRPKRSAGQRTEGEFACGEIGSWHLAEDMRPDRKGHFLAAYLGKGEPSECMRRGRYVPNTKKPVRGRSFGGTQPDGKYDAPQGAIEGTIARKDRFFISNALKALVQGRAPKNTSRGHKTAFARRAQPRQLKLQFSAN